MTKKRDIVIAGYSETAIDYKSGRSAYDLGGEALAKLFMAFEATRVGTTCGADATVDRLILILGVGGALTAGGGWGCFAVKKEGNVREEAVWR